MEITDFLLLLLVFLISAFGSRWMMNRLGYGIHGRLASGQTIILIIMKIILMTIWAIVLIVLLWLMGINPLEL